METGCVCNYCGIIENNCDLKNDIFNTLDFFFIPVLNNIIIEYLECKDCLNIIHRNILCCDYMCECEDFECTHFFRECLECDESRMICL